MQLEKEQTNVNQLYEDYGSALSSAFSPSRSYSSSSAYQQQSQYSPPGLSSMPTPTYSMPLASAPAAPSQPIPPATPSMSEKSISSELDLNDPSTLEIYSRILLFKDDRMRDELAFSRTLSPKQRRVVHLIAQKLGVYHYSVGEGEERYAVVTRIDPQRVSHPTVCFLLGVFTSTLISSNSNSSNRNDNPTLFRVLLLPTFLPSAQLLPSTRFESRSPCPI